MARTYALETTGVRPIIDMGTNFFRLRLEQSKEVIITERASILYLTFGGHYKLEKKLIVSAIAVIDSERRGYSVDRDALRQILRMLHTLGMRMHVLMCSCFSVRDLITGIYADKFEVPFIMQSRSFFHSDVQVTNTLSIFTRRYIDPVSCLSDEIARCFQWWWRGCPL